MQEAERSAPGRESEPPEPDTTTPWGLISRLRKRTPSHHVATWVLSLPRRELPRLRHPPRRLQEDGRFPQTQEKGCHVLLICTELVFNMKKGCQAFQP